MAIKISTEKERVYGLEGIAELFGCSKSTAHHIVKSGVIDGAISRFRRQIVCDVEMALELTRQKNSINT